MKLICLTVFCLLLILLCPQEGFAKKRKLQHILERKINETSDLRKEIVQEDHGKSDTSGKYPPKLLDSSPPRGAIDSMKSTLNSMKTSLEGKTDAASRQLRKLVDRTKTGLTNLDNRWLQTPEARRGEIATALTTAAGKLTKFKDAGKNPLEAIRGGIDIAATFASLAGPHGQVISVALSFISGFLSLFGKGEQPKPMDQIIRQEIQRWYSEHLTSEARGAISSFENSQAFLDGTTSDLGPEEQLGDSETTSLSAHIPVYQNVQFMGSLRYEIEKLKTDNLVADAEKCLKYIELWAEMALLKDVILQRMAAIMANSQDRIRSGVYSVQSRLRRKARNLFKFLWEAGVGNNIVPYFDPDKYPVVDKYLSTILKEPSYDRSKAGKYFINVQTGRSYGRLGFETAVPNIGGDQMATITDGGDYYWKLVPHGNNLYSIVNKYNCDGQDPLCDTLLTWTESHGIYYATLDKSDPALWQLSRQGRRYKLKCKKGCDTGHAMCDAELSYMQLEVEGGGPFLGVILTRNGGKTWGLRRQS